MAKKIKRAVTDTDNEVRYDPAPSPACRTCCRSSARPPAATPRQLADGYTQYGPLKADTAEAVVEVLRPIQARYAELAADPAGTARLLDKGAGKARLDRRPHPRPGPAPPSACSPGLTVRPPR